MSHHKGLNVWQLTLLALGTVVGGSFFLGSSIAIKAAGPAVVISYILGGALVYLILYSLSEMTVANPCSGSFRTYCENMYGPIAGFTVGWVYWTGLVLAMSSEAIAVSVFLQRWIPAFPLPLLGSLVIIVVTVINLLGVENLSKLEGGLAVIKLLALLGFVIIAALLVTGLLPGQTTRWAGPLVTENLLPGGIAGVAGSMLIVMFTYAGFEIIGLAAAEAEDPHRTIPKAITYTVLGLVSLYLLTIIFLLPLVPTAALTEETSPLVIALVRNGQLWAGDIINIILVIAILSTMLAATFGIARMVRSLAADGHAPNWLRDQSEIPYRGIIFSGIAMLSALALGYLLPRQVYIFLISSGGFSLLFVYVVILITHIKFRSINGCPPDGKCKLPGYPYTSILALISLIAIIVSMPLIPGQGSGLIAGLLLVVIYLLIYLIKRLNYKRLKKEIQYFSLRKTYKTKYSTEFSENISIEEKYLKSTKSTTKKDTCPIKNKQDN
ncbi:MAG: amino acid permease [Halanaerobiales bacterium]